jgi:ATP-dependent protease HslVU (ClpYQ) peptidase subunit
MDTKFIEDKFQEIMKELEKEVMEILKDQSLDKKATNLRMKPIVATKKILLNALDSIKLAVEVSKEEQKK